MTALGQLLIALATTIPGKVLTALGIGWLTFTGVTAAASTIRDSVLAAWGGIPGAVAQIFSLGGVDEAVGVVLGAYVAKAALAAIPKLGKVVS